MLVNCFLLWLVHSRGCSCLSCTNKTVGYCSVGALQGGAVVPTAPTELWGYCSVGALETSAPPESTP